MDRIIAFDLNQQPALELLHKNLKEGNVPSNSISFANDLLDKGQRLNLSEKQLFWVNRLGLVKPKPKSELETKLDKLEEAIKIMAKKNSYVNTNTLIFAEDLIKKGKAYGQLSEKQIYWVEEITKQGIARPAAIFCSICNRKGHSSYSCWRRDGRSNSKLPKIDMSLSLSEEEEQELSEIPNRRYANSKDISSVKDDDYIGNWRKDNMPDFF